jgi:uncharacterized protein (DUF1778 family)
LTPLLQAKRLLLYWQSGFLVEQSNTMTQYASEVRVTARMPGHIKQTIEEAAVLGGVSVTQFLVRSAYEMAKTQLAEEHLIQLDRLSSAAFAAALDEPATPNEALRAFVKENKDVGTPGKTA